MEEVKKPKIKFEELPVKKFRERLFIKQAEHLHGLTTYDQHFKDDLPERFEKLPGFIAWESFSVSWDVLWVGLDPLLNKWVLGRHNSPMRKIVFPMRIVTLDDRTKRMMITAEDRKDIDAIPLPNQQFEETEQDRIISESLSGKVVVDEPDEEKAKRIIKSTMAELKDKLAYLENLNLK